MRTLLCLLLLPLFALAQTKDGRQLVVVTISYEPDQTTSDRDYYLVADIPNALTLKPNQTFLLQSAWHKEGDSIVSIGAGTVRTVHDTYVELLATLYPGKKVQKGDMAIFLATLRQSTTDSLLFKLARNDINFTTIQDSLFYDRNTVLVDPLAYTLTRLLERMANDIRYTAKEMMKQDDSQNRDITIGNYKGQKLFAMMQNVTSDDVYRFLLYVYARPEKYKAHTWRISETFATWVINGTPGVK